MNAGQTRLSPTDRKYSLGWAVDEMINNLLQRSHLSEMECLGHIGAHEAFLILLRFKGVVVNATEIIEVHVVF